MLLEVRTLEPADTPEVMRLWKENMIYDSLTPQRFQEVVFEDPHFNRSGNLVAVQEGIIRAIGCCVVRDEKIAHLQCFVIPEQQEEAGHELLRQIEAHVRQQEATKIQVVNYPGGRYFFSGIDPRYERVLSLLEEAGYKTIEITQDAAVDLVAWEPAKEQIAKEQELAETNVRIRPFEPAMLKAMEQFVSSLDMPHWFPDGWQQQWQAGKDVLVVMEGNRIIGYTELETHGKEVAYGPMAVLEELRGKGIGSTLVFAAMRVLKERGITRATAHWVWPLAVYTKNGWHVSRQYHVLEKLLDHTGQA